MHVTVNGHALLILPALHGGHATLQIGRDFLPGAQPLVGLAACRRGEGGDGLSHGRNPSRQPWRLQEHTCYCFKKLLPPKGRATQTTSKYTIRFWCTLELATVPVGALQTPGAWSALWFRPRGLALMFNAENGLRGGNPMERPARKVKSFSFRGIALAATITLLLGGVGATSAFGQTCMNSID